MRHLVTRSIRCVRMSGAIKYMLMHGINIRGSLLHMHAILKDLWFLRVGQVVLFVLICLVDLPVIANNSRERNQKKLWEHYQEHFQPNVEQ